VCTDDDCIDGNCVNVAVTLPAGCDDGNPCTLNDFCDSTECISQQSACHDNNPCTNDGCVPNGQTYQCVHTVPPEHTGWVTCGGTCSPPDDPNLGCNTNHCLPCPAVVGGESVCTAPDAWDLRFCGGTCPNGFKIIGTKCYDVHDPATGCDSPGIDPCTPPDFGPYQMICQPHCDYQCGWPAYRCEAGCCDCNGDEECNAHIGEARPWCPDDCKCGDGACEPNWPSSETTENCPEDCACGNGYCDSGESDPQSPTYCAQECPCGDLQCSAGETAADCPTDCDFSPPVVSIADPVEGQAYTGRILAYGTVTDNVATHPALTYIVFENTYGEPVAQGDVTYVGNTWYIDVNDDGSLFNGQYCLGVIATDGRLEGNDTHCFRMTDCDAPIQDICLGVEWVGSWCKTQIYAQECEAMVEETAYANALTRPILRTQDVDVDGSGHLVWKYDLDGNPLYADMPAGEYSAEARRHYANPGAGIYSGTVLANYGYPSLPDTADLSMFRVAAPPAASQSFQDWLAARQIEPNRYLAWGLNGSAARSCEEYVGEKYWGWSMFEDRVKPILGDYHAQIRALRDTVQDPTAHFTNGYIYSRGDDVYPVQDVLDTAGQRWYPGDPNPAGGPLYAISTGTTFRSEYAKFHPGPSNLPPAGSCPTCRAYEFQPGVLFNVEQEEGVTADLWEALVRNEIQLLDPAATQAEEERQRYFLDLMTRRRASDQAYANAKSMYRTQTGTMKVLAARRMLDEYHNSYDLDQLMDAEMRAAIRRGCFDVGKSHCSWSAGRFVEAMRAKVRKRQESDFDRCKMTTRDDFRCRDAGHPYDPEPTSPGAPFLCQLQAPNMVGSVPYLPGDYRLNTAALEMSFAIGDAFIREVAAGWDVDPDTGLIRQVGQGAADEWRLGGDIFGVVSSYDIGWSLLNLAPSRDENDVDLEVHAVAKTDVRVLGATVPIVEFQASANTGATAGEDSVHVDNHLQLLGGINVWGLAKDFPATYSIIDNMGDDDERDVAQATFFILFVPVTLKGGIAGKVGVELALKVGYKHDEGHLRASAEGVVSPFVQFAGFVFVGIDVGIAQIGIKGSLTIIKVELPFTVGVYIEPVVPVGTTDVVLELTTGTDLKLGFTMMSGKIEAVVKFLLWKAEQVIVEWDGIKDEHTLFSARTPAVDLVRIKGHVME
jgi:hypothetical protein